MNFEGLIEVEVLGGYAAQLGDGWSYQFSICEPCLKVLFKQFKLPPTKDAETVFAREPAEKESP